MVRFTIWPLEVKSMHQTSTVKKMLSVILMFDLCCLGMILTSTVKIAAWSKVPPNIVYIFLLLGHALDDSSFICEGSIFTVQKVPDLRKWIVPQPYA
jgi:hypothetical protein